MNDWEMRQLSTFQYSPISEEHDPYKEHVSGTYADTEDERMIFDGGRDTPELHYFTQLMRTQVNPELLHYRNIENEGCIVHLFRRIITRWNSTPIQLILDIHHSTNPYMMIYIANMFASIGHRVEVYWNIMPNTSLIFTRNGDPMRENLLSVQDMYVSREQCITKEKVHHYVYRNISEYHTRYPLDQSTTRDILCNIQ